MLIRQALRQLTGGGTAIVPALKLASNLLAATGNDTKVVLLFTDGESGETSAQLANAIQHLPVGSLHVIALGDQLPAQWLDVPVGSITALTHLNNADEVEWVMGRALYGSLALGWSGPNQPPSSNAQLTSTLSSKQVKPS